VPPANASSVFVGIEGRLQVLQRVTLSSRIQSLTKRRKIGPITRARAEQWKRKMPALVEELKRRQEIYLDLDYDRAIRNAAMLKQQAKPYDVLTVGTA
jgi:hypothetical protein